MRSVAKVFFLQTKKTELMHRLTGRLTGVFSTGCFYFFGFIHRNIDTQVSIVVVLTLCILGSFSCFFLVSCFLTNLFQ